MNARPPRPPPPHDPVREAWLRERFQGAGIALLICGLAAGILVLLLVKPPPPADYEEETIGNSKVYEQNLEHLGGKSAVLGVEIGDWWDSLWHGRRLAVTLIVLSGSGAGVCFFFAYLLGLPPRE